MNRNARCRAAAALLSACLAAGCTLIQTAADVPAQAVRSVTPGPRAAALPDPVDIQQNLLRFADAFASRTTLGIDALRTGDTALSPTENLRWKLAFSGAACSIASGPNAVANLLDMTVFVTEARLSLEEHWQPAVFGDSAQRLLEDCRHAEKDLWAMTEKVLQPEQAVALREAILLWHAQYARPDSLLVTRAVGLAMQVAQAHPTDKARPGSLLSLLLLDPLAELDPARRELAQTRLFAERALFVAQLMPTLLRWQTELLGVTLLEQPALQEWSAFATRMADAGDRLTRAAEHLPLQFRAEREALLEALDAQQNSLRPLLNEARQALDAGTGLSASLHTTLLTFDAVLQRLGVGEPDAPSDPDTPSEPFRIQAYGEVAARLEAAARQCTELLETFDQTLGANSRETLAAQLAPVLQRAHADSVALIDHLFWRAALLAALLLAAAVAYRLLRARLISPPSPSRNGPG